MIKQLSVFVENRPGSLMDVTSQLTEAHINIRAVSSFVSEVLGAELEDKKGTLNNMLTILAEGKININYIYSFIIRDGLAPVMVFHTDDFDKAIESLKKANVKIVDENEL